jgi:hypothetical protein
MPYVPWHHGATSSGLPGRTFGDRGAMSARHGGIVADWSRAFDDRIPLRRGRQLVTLKDAANYIQKLPKAEQNLEK